MSSINRDTRHVAREMQFRSSLIPGEKFDRSKIGRNISGSERDALAILILASMKIVLSLR